MWTTTSKQSGFTTTTVADTPQKDDQMTTDNNDDFKDSDDILLQMMHEDGTVITFITAPPSVFSEQTEELEPIVYGLSEQDIYVVFNGEVIQRLVADSVEKNGDTYGVNASTFLPLSFVINKGIKATEEYMKKNK